MAAKDYCTAALALIRRTRCWKNRCNTNAFGACHGEREALLRPAFQDTSTGVIYLSCFTDGRPAPVHVLDGLPDSAVLQRAPDGRVAAIKQTVVAGFSREGQFYTREQAASMRQRTQPNALCATAWRQGHRFLFYSSDSASAWKECRRASAAE